MLPSSRRLKKSDFKLLKNTPKKIFQSENLCLKIRFSGSESGRFAVVVPSSVFKKSTARNKLKRRLRAVILKNLPKTVGKFAAIIYVKKGTGLLAFPNAEKELTGLFKKAGILK